MVGAGDFIGAAIAKRFAAGGFTAAVGRRHADKLEPLVAEIAASGGCARAFALDARDEANVQEVFAAVERELGPLEVVVFNVGANVSTPITETTSRLFRKVWEMACLAGFLTGREAARVMLPRRRGSIFFTGATASVRGGKGYAAFASAKFGLRALAQSMARELGPENIHVAPPDRCRRRYGVRARAHPGIGARPLCAAARRADESRLDRRGLLDAPSAAARRVDVRARSASAG